MGFGILFIGYFIAFLMSLHKFGFLCRIIGYYVIFLSVQKLSEYKRSLARTAIPLLIMTLCGVYDAGAMISESIFASVFPAPLSYAIDLVEIAAGYVFHIFLLKAIIALGQETELPKICSCARWNLAVVTSYCILSAILMVMQMILWTSASSELLAFAGTLSRITLLAGILYPLLVLILIHSCYAQICAPEDLDMKPKPSRFNFVNKSREMSAEKDKEMETWLAEQQAKTKHKKK